MVFSWVKKCMFNEVNHLAFEIRDCLSVSSCFLPVPKLASFNLSLHKKNIAKSGIRQGAVFTPL